MAKVRSNLIIDGIGGMLGNQLVFKRDKAGRTVDDAALRPNQFMLVSSMGQPPHRKPHSLPFRGEIRRLASLLASRS